MDSELDSIEKVKTSVKTKLMGESGEVRCGRNNNLQTVLLMDIEVRQDYHSKMIQM